MGSVFEVTPALIVHRAAQARATAAEIGAWLWQSDRPTLDPGFSLVIRFVRGVTWPSWVRPHALNVIGTAAVDRRVGSVPVLERLLRRRLVDLDTGCWIWTGGRRCGGYGSIHIGARAFLVHRVAFAVFHQWFDLESPALICHNCDNPPCFNPDHLYLGTYATNGRDAAERGRTSRGETHPNHKLSEGQAREALARVRSGESYASIARELKVSANTIRRIAYGLKWSYLGGVPERHRYRVRGSENGRSKLKDEDVHAIRASLAAGESRASIAARYGVVQQTVSKIGNRASWAHLS